MEAVVETIELHVEFVSAEPAFRQHIAAVHTAMHIQHVASEASAWGFCYFNNMAVALETLREQKKIESACVLDIDLHFGDGTANILENRNWMTVINVEADSRSHYLQEVEETMKNCGVDLIGISAGFDNHVED